MREREAAQEVGLKEHTPQEVGLKEHTPQEAGMEEARGIVWEQKRAQHTRAIPECPIGMIWHEERVKCIANPKVPGIKMHDNPHSLKNAYNDRKCAPNVDESLLVSEFCIPSGKYLAKYIHHCLTVFKVRHERVHEIWFMEWYVSKQPTVICQYLGRVDALGSAPLGSAEENIAKALQNPTLG